MPSVNGTSAVVLGGLTTAASVKPLLVARGTFGTTSGTWSGVYGATPTLNNLLLATVSVNGFTAFGTCTTPTGWTLLNTSEAASGSNSNKLWLFYKIAAGADAQPSFTTNQQAVSCVIEEWSGNFAQYGGVILTDSFTAADGSITGHVADTGQVWAGSGSSISSNALLPGGNFTSFSTINVVVADYTVQVTLTAIDSTHFPQINPRYVDANNFLLLQQNDATHYYFGKRIAGTYTQLALIAVTPTVGDVLTVQVSGSTCTVWINGTQQFTGSVTGISTSSTLIGFGQGTSGVGKFDSMVVSQPAGSPVPLTFRQSGVDTDHALATASVTLANALRGDWIYAASSNRSGTPTWSNAVALETTQTPGTPVVTIGTGQATGTATAAISWASGGAFGHMVAMALVQRNLRTVSTTAAASLGGLTVTSSGNRIVSGSGAIALPTVTVSSLGKRTRIGVAANPLGSLTVASTGIFGYAGVAVVSISSLTMTGVGTRIAPSPANFQLGGLTVSALVEITSHDAGCRLWGLHVSAYQKSTGQIQRKSVQYWTFNNPGVDLGFAFTPGYILVNLPADYPVQQKTIGYVDTDDFAVSAIVWTDDNPGIAWSQALSYGPPWFHYEFAIPNATSTQFTHVFLVTRELSFAEGPDFAWDVSYPTGVSFNIKADAVSVMQVIYTGTAFGADANPLLTFSNNATDSLSQSITATKYDMFFSLFVSTGRAAINWTSPTTAAIPGVYDPTADITIGGGLQYGLSATPSSSYSTTSADPAAAMLVMGFNIITAATVTLGGLSVSGTRLISRTGTAHFVLGTVGVGKLSTHNQAFFRLGALTVLADTEVEIPDTSNVTLGTPITFAVNVSAAISSTPIDDRSTQDQARINYDATTVSVDTVRHRLLSQVSVVLPVPTIIEGKPMLPLVQGFTTSALTVSGLVVPDPDPILPGVDPPATKGGHNDGGGFAKWHVTDLPDPADFGGFYWLGDPTSADGSDTYGNAGTHQWAANGHSNMASPPAWHSIFPYKPGVASHTWYGPNGNSHTVTKAVRFNTEYIEHMWIDMGAGAASSPPITWLVVGMIQHFDFEAQRHFILDSGVSPASSGIHWTTDDVNKTARLPADPTNYRLAMTATHQRFGVHTSMKESSKTLRTPFTHDYLPKMFFTVVNSSSSMAGYQYPHGRHVKKGSLDNTGADLRKLVLGRSNGILSGRHAAHLVVFEMRMWNRALDLDELDAQYDQLSSTWKFHQYY